MKRSDIGSALRSSGGKTDNETLREAFESLEARRGLGWISATDTQYTSASPLSAPAGAKTPLTLTYSQLDDAGQWSEDMDSGTLVGSRFYARNAGDVYVIRVGLTVRTAVDMQSGLRGVIASLLFGNLVAASMDRQADVEVGIEFEFFDISDTFVLPRRDGDARNFTRAFEIQVRSSSEASLRDVGGQFYIKPDEDCEVYDIDVSVRRSFSAER